MRGTRKIRIGRIVSDKMDKTVTVAVEWRQPHRMYGKSVKKVTKFHVHDELGQNKIGDVVKIAETRPLSRMKRWRIVDTISAADTDMQDKSVDVDEDLSEVISENAINDQGMVEEL